MTERWLAMLLVLALGPLTTASAQIAVGADGDGGGVSIAQRDRYRGPSEIFVTTATYGGNCGAPRGNASHGVINACGGRHYCVYKVDWRLIGDPRPGCGKDFHVGYTCREGEGERGVSLNPEASGHSVVLDCRR